MIAIFFLPYFSDFPFPSPCVSLLHKIPIKYIEFCGVTGQNVKMYKDPSLCASSQLDCFSPSLPNWFHLSFYLHVLGTFVQATDKLSLFGHFICAVVVINQLRASCFGFIRKHSEHGGMNVY
ncbi:hypothetical protein AMECASPLE_004725 [Ameca splendens]|uniref:Uncharacterized protein n=1 Tax=Ameca splendens TaxID=208324 RepID=A0ABV0YWY7_9TELE